MKFYFLPHSSDSMIVPLTLLRRLFSIHLIDKPDAEKKPPPKPQ